MTTAIKMSFAAASQFVITLGVVNEQQFKVECVGFLETLQTGCVDQVLDDVSLEQVRQFGRVAQNGVQLGG